MPLHGGHGGSKGGWAWLYLGGEAAAFAAFLVGLLILRRRPARLAVVAGIAAAIQLAPLAGPLLMSTDAWTYWDYGRIAAVRDGNPYVDRPIDYRDDPAYPHMGSAWHRSTSVYGPAFTLASEPVALVAGDSAAAAAWLFKGLAALAMLVVVALTALLAPRRPFAVAFVGWNPLLALQFGGGGHNDAWMAALVVGALALAGSRRRQAAGVAWAAAILVKWVAAIFLPLRALEARASGRRVGHAGFALSAAALAAVSWWQFGWHWLGAFGPLSRNANNQKTYALPHRLFEHGVPRSLAIGLFAVAFALAYAWLARQAWRGRARLGLASALLLCASPYLVPWYLVWAAPLAVIDDDPPAEWIVLALTAYMLRQRVPI